MITNHYIGQWWLAADHWFLYLLRILTEQHPEPLAWRLFHGCRCHGEEEDRALKEEVNFGLFSLHCWVMILHRPHGQHAASQRLCASERACDWMVCVHEGETVSVIPGGREGCVLWMIFVCPWQLCVFVSKVCSHFVLRVFVWVCVFLPLPQEPLWPALTPRVTRHPSFVWNIGLFHPTDRFRPCYIFQLSPPPQVNSCFSPSVASSSSRLSFEVLDKRHKQQKNEA